MFESIHDYVVEKLQECKGEWSRVAKDTGIPKRSIEKIARREWVNPGVNTIETLAFYFRDPAAWRRAKRVA